MASGFWEKVEPGTLRKRVTFYKAGAVRDGYGKITNGMTEVVTVWADFYPVRGQEFYEVQKIQGKVTHKCYCRFHSMLKDIDSTWYLMYKGKFYSIESAVDAGYAGRYFEIYCSEHIDKDMMPVIEPLIPEAPATEEPSGEQGE